MMSRFRKDRPSNNGETIRMIILVGAVAAILVPFSAWTDYRFAD